MCSPTTNLSLHTSDGAFPLGVPVAPGEPRVGISLRGRIVCLALALVHFCSICIMLVFSVSFTCFHSRSYSFIGLSLIVHVFLFPIASSFFYVDVPFVCLLFVAVSCAQFVTFIHPSPRSRSESPPLRSLSL